MDRDRDESKGRPAITCRSFYFLYTREIYTHYVRRRGDGTRSNINHSVQYALSLQNETKRMAVADIIHHVFMSSQEAGGLEIGQARDIGNADQESQGERKKWLQILPVSGFLSVVCRMSGNQISCLGLKPLPRFRCA